MENLELVLLGLFGFLIAIAFFFGWWYANKKGYFKTEQGDGELFD